MKRRPNMKTNIFDHYIAIDWSMKNMAIARMTNKSNKITTIDVPSDVGEVKVYLENLKGTKILAIEETTTSQWLYTELKDHVNEILVCDPHRNHLLSEGPKTDKIDAMKLVKLLKSGLMKEVFHSTSPFLYIREIVSGYEDLIKLGVKLKNQKSAFLRAKGKEYKNKKEVKEISDDFVLSSLEQIENYEKEKEVYKKMFKKLSKTYELIRRQKSLPGIKDIHAVKIVSRVVSPHRFASKGHYLSYVGLVKLDRVSGGKSYGRKNSRYSRQLKSVYKVGVQSALKGNNPIRSYYDYLINEKGYPEYQARHQASRRLAILSWGVFKSKKKYQAYRYGEKNHNLNNTEVRSGL